jgi:hypothetical protein
MIIKGRRLVALAAAGSYFAGLVALFAVFQTSSATEGVDGEPLRHPLLSVGADAVLAERPELSAEQQVRELVMADGWMEAEDGTVTSLSGVSWRETSENAEPGLGDLRPHDAHTLEVAAEVTEWMATPGAPAADIWLSIDPSWDTGATSSHEQILAILHGEVETRGDFKAVRAEAVAARKLAGQQALAPLASAVVAAGGEVIEQVTLSGSLRARLTPEQASELLEFEGLVQVEAHYESEADAGISMYVEGSIDGIETEDLLQIRHYYDQAYRGEPDEQVIITEPDAATLRSTHLTFYDGSSNRRIILCGGSGATCTDSAPSSGDAHPTKVASVLLSDLTLEQDPNVTTTADKKERSGVARRTKAIAIDDGGRVALARRVVTVGRGANTVAGRRHLDG